MSLTKLAGELAALAAHPGVRTAAIDEYRRAVQVVAHLTRDTLIQKLAARMPSEYAPVNRLEHNEDWKEVTVEITRDHVTAPEARRFLTMVDKVYDAAIDYWGEKDLDKEDKKGRRVAKDQLGNLRAAANMAFNYRETQLPGWLRVALGDAEHGMYHNASARTGFNPPETQPSELEPMGRNQPISDLASDGVDPALDPSEELGRMGDPDVVEQSPEGVPAKDPMAVLEEMAKFEEGKPADPTQGMSEEDKAEWEKQNAIHRSEFTDKAAGIPVLEPAPTEAELGNVREVLDYFRHHGWKVEHGDTQRAQVTNPAGNFRAWVTPRAVFWKYGKDLADKLPGRYLLHSFDPRRDSGDKMLAELRRDLKSTQEARAHRSGPDQAEVRIAQRVAALDAARQRIVDHLRKSRWSVDTDVSPPEATSPDGTTRVWIDPSGASIKHGRTGDLDRDGAARLDLPDLSEVSGPQFEAAADRWVVENTKDEEVEGSVMDPTLADEMDPMLALEQMAKFEEGEPADPTENMSPEDAAAWREEHKEHQDEFKAAAADPKDPPMQAIRGFVTAERGIMEWWQDNKHEVEQEKKQLVALGGKHEVLAKLVDTAFDALVHADAAFSKLGRAVADAKHRFGSEDLTTDREAASGLYGYPKRVEQGADAVGKRLGRAAERLGKGAYDRDPRVLAFLRARARRGCRAAALLAHELDEAGALSSSAAPRRAGESGGLYGWGEKAAEAGLRACADLEREAGVLACAVLERKDAGKLSAFLREHAVRASCPRASLLAYALPDEED